MKIYRIAGSAEEPEIWEDAKGDIVWIKGDTKHSPLTYFQFKEMIGANEGASVTIPNGRTFYAPFRKREKSLNERLRDDNRIPLTFDYEWDDIIDGIPVCIFSSISDDTETMGGIGVNTEHALGYDKNGRFFHWIKETYEDGEETDWYDA